ncbi:MAG: leucine--tRNA ligase [Candidatus Woesearchaeota archaeon]|jgi:leucyl-tRNA synthetase|nr:leucine--tRNA ligase [Candidatus Woesearchaeota archaeon]MDP7467203.1 leucine--tRNA ligase [Candidatus Woesearchaeota archaeon]MDP7647462.1 leucine--tRNA ligase [Candidatus Woesearchaeota archaeon]
MDLQKVAKKWQARWDKDNAFKSKEVKKQKFYCLEMWPYPSGKMHMGHVRNYSIGDAFARYKRMSGGSILYPMGWDAFGLPAENAAIKNKTHPRIWTKNCIAQMKEQLQSFGFSYDWDREVSTAEPEYYKWNQWLFQQMLERGLAYQKESLVNWCPSCTTVLANEQVEAGKCWRCESVVENKQLKQWFFKITQYAEELLRDLDKLGTWPERVRTMQDNWIGKSQGINFIQKVKDLDLKFEVYDSIPQTFLAQTFCIIAPEHPMVKELVKGTKQEKEVLDFVETVKQKKSQNKFNIETDMEGVFTGRYVDNPFGTGDLPIWVASFVLYEYGTGIVNCSAHDERDFEFAKKYDIPLKVVLLPKDKKHAEQVQNLEVFYRKPDGILQAPEEVKGKAWHAAREQVIQHIEKKGFGKRTTNYKLRDWLISRQRYWGTPIPVVFCDKCGVVPAKLPVKLPDKAEFTGEGNPLAVDSFINTECPKCRGPAKRETDTMDTFVDSSWYFLRFTDPKNKKEIFSKDKADYWMPVDQYIGGIEHAVLHLLYARFIFKVIRDLGLTKHDEPFSSLLCQGMVVMEGAKMSKSKGNVVDPGEMLQKYGPDTMRLFILFASAPEKELDWNDDGIEAMHKFVLRMAGIKDLASGDGSKDKHLASKLQQTLQAVSNHLETFEHNFAVQKLMEITNFFYQHKSRISEKARNNSLATFSQIISPFAPHLAEELWEGLGNKTLVSLARWPRYNERLVKLEFDAEDALIDAVGADVAKVVELTKIQPKKITLFVAAPWKRTLYAELKELMKDTRDVGKIMQSLMSGKLKPHGQAIAKMVPKLVSSPQRIPAIIFDEKQEREFLEGLQLEAEVMVVAEEKASHDKAKQALPGKPAILVE